MRLVSLLALAAIVGGGVYVVFFTDLLKRGQEAIQGYKDAKTPLEAMDYFRKAIQARKYDTAAKYCTAEYAEQLQRAHKAAAEMGVVIDGIMGYIKEKGLNSDKAVSALTKLDAFPTWFKVKDTPTVKGDKATGTFDVETQVWAQFSVDFSKDLHGWEAKHFQIFRNCLVPPQMQHAYGLQKGQVDLVKDGEVWKLDFKLGPNQANDIAYYLAHYKSFHTALEIIKRDHTTNFRGTKDDFANELVEFIRKSK